MEDLNESWHQESTNLICSNVDINRTDLFETVLNAIALLAMCLSLAWKTHETTLQM